MTGKLKIAFWCNLGAVVIVSTIAIIYLLTPQLLPYQEAAIGMSWAELQPGLKTQFLSLLKVSGGGYLFTAISLLVLLLIPFKKGEAWARNAIPAIGIPAVLIVNYAGLTIILNTPGRPPLFAGPIVVILLLAGWFLSGEMKSTEAPSISETSENS